MDYAGNPKNQKSDKVKPEKKVESVVTGKVVVQKKSLARKFRDLFIEADFKSVSRYVVSDVLLPAIRNTIVDASTKGIERMMYGESTMRRRNFGPGPRISYNQSPLNRGYGSVGPRNAPPISIGPRSSRASREDFILATREEAELVLERMNDIIDQYEVVTLADLNSLVDYPTSFVDNGWGWAYLGDVQVRQVREGYLLDLPPAERIS